MIYILCVDADGDPASLVSRIYVKASDLPGFVADYMVPPPPILAWWSLSRSVKRYVSKRMPGDRVFLVSSRKACAAAASIDGLRVDLEVRVDPEDSWQVKRNIKSRRRFTVSSKADCEQVMKMILGGDEHG